MINFSIVNPVFEDQGIKCTFKRCTFQTFSNWYLNHDELSTIDVEVEIDEKTKKQVVKTDSLTNKEKFVVQRAHILFMADRLLYVAGLVDSESGQTIEWDKLKGDFDNVVTFIEGLFDQSEKFYVFFNKFKDGAEKKSV